MALKCSLGQKHGMETLRTLPPTCRLLRYTAICRCENNPDSGQPVAFIRGSRLLLVLPPSRHGLRVLSQKCLFIPCFPHPHDLLEIQEIWNHKTQRGKGQLLYLLKVHRSSFSLPTETFIERHKNYTYLWAIPHSEPSHTNSFSCWCLLYLGLTTPKVWD